MIYSDIEMSQLRTIPILENVTNGNSLKNQINDDFGVSGFELFVSPRTTM